MQYEDFLQAKAQSGADSGFAPVWLPDYLFDFQSATVDWAIRANDLGAVAKESLDLPAACIRLHDQLGGVQALRERSVK